MSERDKKGLPILDPPPGDEPAVIDMMDEWRRHFRKQGHNDPDLIDRLARRAMEEDNVPKPNAEPIGADSDE